MTATSELIAYLNGSVLSKTTYGNKHQYSHTKIDADNGSMKNIYINKLIII